MLAAVIAIAVTLVVLVVAVLVAFSIRNRQKSTKVGGGRKVNSIDTVGVSSTLPKKNSHGSPHAVAASAAQQGASVAVSEKLKTRFVAMGAFAVAIFGILGARLFSMQVLTGEEYTKKANDNLYTTVSTAAPRGCIYDANGVALVKNRTSLTVLADKEVAEDRTVVQRLSALLGIPHNIVRKRILDSSGGAQSQRVVASDVKMRDIAYLSEHPDAFPGIDTQTRTVREYPWGALAAHVLGYTQPVVKEDLGIQKAGSEIEMGDNVGRGGVEASYESLLAGDHGQRTVVADAQGTVRQIVSETDPTKGNDIYLTIRAPVQQVADQVLAKLIAPRGTIGTGTGTAGALVCLDVTDGSVVALSSFPTFTPESFVGGIADDAWNLFNSDAAHNPLMNRAISGEYPAASTFKAFTGMAGLEYGFADAKRTWNCTGLWNGFGNTPQACWQTSGHGIINFDTGVVVSCDVVFYEIAKGFYDARAKIGETAMQDFLKRFGFAGTTGIDLGGEAAGRIPTPEWKAEFYKDAPEKKTFVPGDLSNMSIGQGDILVTPLQMAVGYCGVATGKLLKPHVLKEVKNSEGDTVLKASVEEIMPLEASEDHLKIMRDSLRHMAQQDSEVSAQFAKYGIDNAAAKTGTAEFAGKGDYGWFACYVPYDKPKYVVACVIEEGGFGATCACPPSVEVLDAVLRYDAGELDPNLNPLAGYTGMESAPTDGGGTADGGSPGTEGEG